MLIAFLVAIATGVFVAGVTITQSRVRITDDARLAFVVAISGAIAGWATVDGVFGVGRDTVNASDVLAALGGAVILCAVAWKSRRETLAEHGFAKPPSGEPETAAGDAAAPEPGSE